MRKKVEIVLLDSEDAYRQEYIKVFINDNKFSLWGVPVVFDEKSFDHIFFEPSEEGESKKHFSKRRAKKMYFIQAMLNDDVDIEVMFEQDTGNFAVFCVDLDCVMYLRNRVGTGSLQIGTFFDFGKEHTKMYNKQRRKCVSITQEEFKARIK
jgi:hypothetical protein